MAEENKTTLGNRLSTAAVNGAVAGGASAVIIASTNGLHKALKTRPNIKWIGKTGWIITGALTAAGAIFGFFWANKNREDNREKVLNEAFNKANDPNNRASEDQRASELLKTMGEVVVDGKADKPSTKFQDTVSASRAAVQQQQAR